MGGPAIGVAVIGVSLVILVTANLVPEKWVDWVAFVGFVSLGFGAILFAIMAGILAFQWAKRTLENGA